jgi:hypothetical protein
MIAFAAAALALLAAAIDDASGRGTPT